MFTYCYNNPVIYKNVTGEAATVCIGNDDYDNLFPWNGIDGVGYADEVLGQKLAAVICAGVIVIGGVVIYSYGQSIYSSASSADVEVTKGKDVPTELPKEKDVGIDMKHIMERHHPDGGKSPQGDKFPKWMTAPVIERLVREAYNDAVANYPNSVLKIQEGVNYLLQGTAAGQRIRIWVNVVERVIKTAFPK